jgi:hypothetical protein
LDPTNKEPTNSAKATTRVGPRGCFIWESMASF